MIGFGFTLIILESGMSFKTNLNLTKVKTNAIQDDSFDTY